jgi:nucleotide-binding universal stress UspA family protein
MRTDKPVIVCFDGSNDGRYAIESAADLFPDRHCVVLTVRQPVGAFEGGMWAGEPTVLVDPIQTEREAATEGERVANEGVRLAQAAGLDAEAVAVSGTAPVWRMIVDAGATFDAAVIVLGSRGLAGLRAMLFGSVSGAVIHHAGRPTLVARRPTT